MQIAKPIEITLSPVRKVDRTTSTGGMIRESITIANCVYLGSLS